MKNIIKSLSRNFVNAKIGDLATNLTYVSFISIFPLVAVVMGLSKGFGLDRLLVNRLKEYVPSSETQLNYILEVAEKLIKSLNSSVLSGVGLVIILWSVINLLMILEKSINIVWQVRENRILSRRIINYIAIIFIIPIVLLLLIGTNDKILQILSSFSKIGIFTCLLYTSPSPRD